jgi:hypothetical protein
MEPCPRLRMARFLVGGTPHRWGGSVADVPGNSARIGRGKPGAMRLGQRQGSRIKKRERRVKSSQDAWRCVEAEDRRGLNLEPPHLFGGEHLLSAATGLIRLRGRAVVPFPRTALLDAACIRGGSRWSNEASQPAIFFVPSGNNPIRAAAHSGIWVSPPHCPSQITPH